MNDVASSTSTRFEVLGCSGAARPGRRPSCYRVGSTVVVDAGCLAEALPPDDQFALEHLFITHSHVDHILSLPLMLDNRMALGAPTLQVHGLSATLRALDENVFNGVLWPTRRQLNTASPAMEFHTLDAGQQIEIDGLRVTPHAMSHTVPCVGYEFCRSDGPSLLVGSDTGQTKAILDAVGGRDMAAVVCEVSWPNRMDELARVTQHLTPRDLQTIDLPSGTQLLLTHLKPAFEDEIRAELTAFTEAIVLEDGFALEF